jgi:hypothetical protein
MGPAAVDPTTWGTAADWVAAIGTVGALFFALVTLRTELRDRRTDRERNRKAQARRIIFRVWSEWPPETDSYGDPLPVPPWNERLRARVTNYSDLPIHTARVHCEFGGEELVLNVTMLLQPGESRTAATKPKRVDELRELGRHTLYFVDAAGTSWARSSALTDVEEPTEWPSDEDKGWPAPDWPPEKDFDAPY